MAVLTVSAGGVFSVSIGGPIENRFIAQKLADFTAVIEKRLITNERWKISNTT